MEHVFKVLEDIEAIGSSNAKLGLLLNSRDPRLNEFLELTFKEDVLNLGTRTIENSLTTKSDTSTLKSKDIGEFVYRQIQELSPKKTIKTDNSEFRKLFEEAKNSSGLKQQASIGLFLIRCSPMEGKWYARCLTKNLHCGLSLKTVNKYFKKIDHPLIKEFSLSLCDRIKCTEHKMMVTGLQKVLDKENEVSVERKYDGFRVLITKDKYTKRIQSRRGKTINTMDLFFEKIEEFLGPKTYSLDGEIYSTDGFQHLMTMVHRKGDIEQENLLKLRFVIFDILMYDDTDLQDFPYYENTRKWTFNRSDVLNAAIGYFKKDDSLKDDIISVIDRVIVSDVDSIVKLFDKYVAEGLEGAVLKNNGPYTRDRKNWWKIKPVDTVDLKIIGLAKGTGKYAGKFSKISVIDSSNTVLSQVGSGLGDIEIEMLTNRPGDYIDSIVEIAFDSLTKPDEAGIRKLRFPRFIAFRDDKTTPDDLSEH